MLNYIYNAQCHVNAQCHITDARLTFYDHLDVSRGRGGEGVVYADHDVRVARVDLVVVGDSGRLQEQAAVFHRCRLRNLAGKARERLPTDNGGGRAENGAAGQCYWNACCNLYKLRIVRVRRERVELEHCS